MYIAEWREFISLSNIFTIFLNMYYVFRRHFNFMKCCHFFLWWIIFYIVSKMHLKPIVCWIFYHPSESGLVSLYLYDLFFIISVKEQKSLSRYFACDCPGVSLFFEKKKYHALCFALCKRSVDYITWVYVVFYLFSCRGTVLQLEWLHSQ